MGNQMNRRIAIAAGLAMLTFVFRRDGVAQSTPAPTPPQGTGRAGGAQRAGPPWRTAEDTARAHRLYISIHPEDLPRSNPRTEARRRTDSIFAARSAGVMDFQRITYKSDVDGLEIPAYVFAPLRKRGAQRHAAMVWVHGFVHGNFNEYFLPFVIE